MKFHCCDRCREELGITGVSESEDGCWEIFVYRVLFGYRVRVGEVGKSFVEVDYCCGANESLLAACYAICVQRLESLPELTSQAVRQALPPTRKKLFYDPEGLQQLGLDHFVDQIPEDLR